MVSMSFCVTSGVVANATIQILGSLMVFLVIVVAGGMLVLWIRSRSLSSRRQDGTKDGGFAMEHLQDLRRSGQISEEEYRRLRRVALGFGEVKAKTDDSASSAPPAGVDDVGNAPPDAPCAEGDGPQKELE